MWCRKCGYRVMHDSLYDSKTFIDLFCIGCGKRWHIDRGHRVVRWLTQNEGRAGGSI